MMVFTMLLKNDQHHLESLFAEMVLQIIFSRSFCVTILSGRGKISKHVRKYVIFQKWREESGTGFGIFATWKHWTDGYGAEYTIHTLSFGKQRSLWLHKLIVHNPSPIRLQESTAMR
jgi:hypothetical protein